MGAAREISQELHALAEQLAAEPFCRKYSLERQSLAKLTLFIEQRESSLQRVAPEAESMKASFRRFKAIYCLFLMQIEEVAPLDSARMNTATLADYLSPGTRRLLGLADPPKPEEDPEEGTEITSIGKLPDFSKPEPEEDEERDEGDVTMVGNIINFAAKKAEAEEEEEVVEEFPEPSIEITQSRKEDSTVGFDTVMRPSVDEEEQVDWGVPTTQEENPKVAPSFEEVSSDEPGELRSAHARDHVAIALTLRQHRDGGKPEFSSPHWGRLELLVLCFALEFELREIMGAGLDDFQPEDDEQKDRVRKIADFKRKLVNPFNELSENEHEEFLEHARILLELLASRTTGGSRG